MDGQGEGGREEGVDGQRWKERGRGHQPSGQPRQIDAVQSHCVSSTKVARTFLKKTQIGKVFCPEDNKIHEKLRRGGIKLHHSSSAVAYITVHFN